LGCFQFLKQFLHHHQACGASIRAEDLDKFKEIVESFV